MSTQRPITGLKGDKARARRKALGPGRSSTIDLGSHRKLLGKVPDVHLARLAGVSRSPVQALRQSLGIPPCRAERRYSPADDSLILNSDLAVAEIAATLGVTPRAVTLRRQWLKRRR